MKRCRYCKAPLVGSYLRVEVGQVVDGQRVTRDRDYCGPECVARDWETT